MTSDTPAKRLGRPPSGVTPKRYVRIGATWTEAERLALQLAQRDGTVRRVQDRETGQVEDRGNMAAYVEEALRLHNARTARQLRKP